MSRLIAAADAIELDLPPPAQSGLKDVFAPLLADHSLAPGFRARALTLPSELQIAEARSIVDPTAIRAARQWLSRTLGKELAGPWRAAYDLLRNTQPYAATPAAAGQRALRNLALTYLVATDTEDTLALARAHLNAADNLTDRVAGLTAIVNSKAPNKADLLVGLARDWAHEPLLMNRWFELQATAASRAGEVPVLNRVRVLLKHRSFSIAHPNSVIALLLGFCAGNPAEFHLADGSGYAFWAEQVLALDRINPTLAARLARTLERWRRFTPDRQPLMKAAIEKVAGAATSRDVREIVNKALAH
jgi:aminopeptidase N